jgi:hypothetical protein
MVSISQADYEELLKKTSGGITIKSKPKLDRDPIVGINTAKKLIAKVRQKMPGKMNRTEGEYHEMLAARSRAGEITWWGYEKMKLKLADNTTITVDFLVITSSNEVELHEVKGTWFPEHNRVKLKVAAEMYPFFRFILCKKDKEGWHYREI